MSNRVLTSAVLLLLLLPAIAFSQTAADPDLLDRISRIKAIDNHAHPLRYAAEGEKPDDEYDALPLEAIEPFPLPARLNPVNPEFIGAWKSLYGYGYTDMGEKHVEELLASKRKDLYEQRQNFPAWVLDQLNIETMFANRIAMGRGLVEPRFRWVSFVDALMFPLSNETAKKSNRDYAGFYLSEEKLLKCYLTDLGLTALPPTLDEFAKRVVTATLERQK